MKVACPVRKGVIGNVIKHAPVIYFIISEVVVEALTLLRASAGQEGVSLVADKNNQR